MRILKFQVETQQINKAPGCDFTGIVSGTEGYLLAQFDFTSEWNGCKKAAAFYSLGKEYGAAIVNGVCEIPAEALLWTEFEVSVVGIKEGYRITTNKCKVTQERG